MISEWRRCPYRCNATSFVCWVGVIGCRYRSFINSCHATSWHQSLLPARRVSALQRSTHAVTGNRRLRAGKIVCNKCLFYLGFKWDVFQFLFVGLSLWGRCQELVGWCLVLFLLVYFVSKRTSKIQFKLHSGCSDSWHYRLLVADVKST